MAVMTKEPRTRAERRGRYPKEFRRDSAALVIDQQRTVADVARSLGLNDQTLGNWVRQERIDRGEREDSRVVNGPNSRNCAARCANCVRSASC